MVGSEWITGGKTWKTQGERAGRGWEDSGKRVSEKLVEIMNQAANLGRGEQTDEGEATGKMVEGIKLYGKMADCR